MQAFLKIVGDLKATDREANKMYAVIYLDVNGCSDTRCSAAFSCIGNIMEVFGAQVRRVYSRFTIHSLLWSSLCLS